jgi:prepilin-type N-terminal cleavage/methylation domain-containing protein
MTDVRARPPRRCGLARVSLGPGDPLRAVMQMARFRRQLDDRGFTLLELILVMVILSTVLALAAPSLQGFFASRQINDTAAQILALTQFARSQAISEGIAYRLNFDTQQRTYWLTAQETGAFEKLKTEFGQVFDLPKDMVMELEDLDKQDQDIFLAFTPYGTVTVGTVRLIDRRGRAFEITCPSATEPYSIIESTKTYARYASR